MNLEDKKEIKELINNNITTVITDINGKLSLINLKLDTIGNQYEGINNRLTNLEKDNAKYINHIYSTGDYGNRIRKMEDSQLEIKSIKKWLISAITIMGVVMGIIFGIFRFVL